MPFGLLNAPAILQRLMNLNFADVINQFVTVYLNDILGYSETNKEHIAYLRRVFN